MKVIIGDIGNTVTKLCLIDINTFKLSKIVYFDSKNIFSKNLLRKKIYKLEKKNNLSKIAFFSSVVPHYKLELKKILYKLYKIKLKEIKDKKFNKIIKINIKNKKQVGSDRIANAVGVYKKY